jgi:transcription elongation GreA/GreB family factor
MSATDAASSLARKRALHAELVRALETDLETLERAQAAAREGATHEEAKPENDKDTRALEQSYLARGQAFRLDELRSGLADVRVLPLRAFGESSPIALGALVSLEGEDDDARVVFLAPYGGGISLGGASKIQVVTPKSPLGRALLGKRLGDECAVELGGRTRDLVVARVE